MARRTVLTITGATGPDAELDAVLAPFNFAPADVVAGVPEALEHLRQTHYDLLLLPMEAVTGAVIGDFEAALHADPAMLVIGTAPTADPDLILRGLRTGAHEFLVRPAVGADIAAALERAQRRATPEGRHGRVVAVYSPKGGMGVTTVAINLAFACAARTPTPRVVLVDLTEDDPDVRLFLNLAPTYDVSDLIARRDDVDASVLSSILTEHPGGVWVLPAAERVGRASLDAATTTTLLGHLRAHFDMVIIDADSSRRDHVISALDAAQMVVLVTQLSLPALRSAQQASQLFRDRGYPDDKVRVVVNRVTGSDAVSLADAGEVLERAVAFTLPNDHRNCTTAVARGKPLLEIAPESRLAKRYAELAEQLLPAGIVPPASATLPVSTRPAGAFSRFFHLGG